MKRPLIVFAIGFLLALYLLQFTGAIYQLALFIAVFIICTVVFMLNKKIVNTKVYIVLLGILFSNGVNFFYSYYFYEPTIEFSDKVVAVSGYIKDSPLMTSTGGYSYTMQVNNLEYQDKEFNKSFKIIIYTNKPIDIDAFQIFSMRCILQLPESAQDSGDFDTRMYLKSKGIYLITNLKSQLLITKTEGIGSNFLLRNAFYFKEHLKTSLLSNNELSPQNALIATSIVTNDKSGLSKDQKQLYVKTGLSHVLAASGMHIAIISSIFLFLLGKLRINKKLSLIIVILPIIFFGAVAGFAPSILRAVFMFIIMAAAFIIDENYDMLNSLAVACILILLVNPFSINDVGFILTAASTLGIIIFYEKIFNKIKLKKQGKVYNFLNYFMAILSLTFSATLLVIPINIIIFNGLSVVSPISNILIVPCIFVVFLLSLITALFTFFMPVSNIAATVLNLILEYTNFVITQLSKVSFSYIDTNNSLYIMWIFYAVSVIILIYFKKEKIKIAPVLMMMFLSFYCVQIYTSAFIYTSNQNNSLRVTVLDVGQGQCVFVRSSNYNMMIDCGSISYNIKAGEIAAQYLDNINVDTIDIFFISHYHADHINGVVDILKRKTVKNIMLLNITDPDGIREQLILLCKNNNINVIDVDSDYNITLSKDAQAFVYRSHISKNNQSAQNENNMVLYLKYKDSEFLFPGDIEGSHEKVISQKEIIDSDVLIVPHHGSKTSSSNEFLKTVSPQISIISVGRDNGFNFPSQEVLIKLEEMGSKIFRTDINKTIIVDTYGDGKYKVQYVAVD